MGTRKSTPTTRGGITTATTGTTTTTARRAVPKCRAATRRDSNCARVSSCRVSSRRALERNGAMLCLRCALARPLRLRLDVLRGALASCCSDRAR
eukprot:2973741-Pyramimonas_sp.AAC.1